MGLRSGANMLGSRLRRLQLLREKGLKASGLVFRVRDLCEEHKSFKSQLTVMGDLSIGSTP